MNNKSFSLIFGCQNVTIQIITKSITYKVFIVFIAVSLFSCSKVDIPELKTDKMENQTFKNESCSDPTASLELSVALENGNGISVESKKPHWWVIATLWRKSAKCRKLGICEWFPDNTASVNSAIMTGRTVHFPIVFDTVNNVFEPILLSFTSSPLFLSSTDIKFYVDEDFDIYIDPENKTPFSAIRIPTGIINFDPLIGKFGGYKINIVGVN
jgi:hypothetical protein